MRFEEFKKLEFGAYRVYWNVYVSEDQKFSECIIGHLHDGTLWMACANWTASCSHGVASTDPFIWKTIKWIEKL